MIINRIFSRYKNRYLIADAVSIYRTAPVELKKRMHLLTLILIGSAAAELLSIGAVLPLIKSLSDPKGTIYSMNKLLGFNITLDINYFQFSAVMAFCLAAVLAGLIRSALVVQTAKLTFGWATHLGVNTFSKVMKQPYEYHIKKNSSDVIGALAKSQMVATSLIMPLIQALTSACIIISIGILFAITTSPLTFLLIILIISIYVIIILNLKNKMISNGTLISQAQNQRVRAVSESLGMIRDIIIDKTQYKFIEKYKILEQNLRNAQSQNTIISSMPRIVIETAGMITIALALLLIVEDKNGIEGALPTIGLLALGAQRVLPLAQQVYVGVVSLAASGPLISDITHYLELSTDENKEWADELGSASQFHDITFENVSYRYETAISPAFCNASFSIERGQRVGIIGPTGGGKSTLINLLAGLLTPSDGCVLINREVLKGPRLEAWHKLIAIVPQNIYLADVSVAENIAVGVPLDLIDYDLLRDAISKARLESFIAALPEGTQTRVGERGVNLSGGQLQRLGIARALYKKPKLLILDEATSALDADTESAVMKEIYDLDPELTIVMTAHRKAVLNGADRIFEVSRGKITEVSSSCS